MSQARDNSAARNNSGASGQTAAYLERLQNLHPKIIDLSLGRIERLLKALGDPQKSLPPVIHVAGTNGKGSVIAFLRAIMEQAGLKVHVYTSPHLVRFNERIRLAGHLIDDQALCRVLEDCERANGDHPITFFEATTAAALLAFSRTPADVVILETGLGGRLDATNVVDRPAATVLTPISHDHEQFLTGDIKAIAAEKAGILKPGVPATIARQTPEVMAIITARAHNLNAPIAAEGIAWKAEMSDDGVSFTGTVGEYQLPAPGLIGPHQIQNAGIAIACVRALPGFEVSEAAIRQGLTVAHWPARLQRLEQGPLAALLPNDSELWLDGGHNPSAGLALAAALRTFEPTRHVHLIIGMLRTKDAKAYLSVLAEQISHLYAVPIPDEFATLSSEELVETAQSLNIEAEPCSSVAEAMKQVASRTTDTQPRVVICGSLYLAGRVLSDNGMTGEID